VDRSRVIRLLSLIFWTATGLLCGVQIWISMITHGHALWRVCLYQVLVWDAWFLFTPLVAWMARRFPLVPPTRGALLAHTLAALALAPVHSAWWTWLMITMRPYDAMGTTSFAKGFSGIVLSGGPLQLMVYVGVLAAIHAADYYEKFRERERAAARLEVSLVEARLHALELQIQPHFLFNTLNSVSALVRAGEPALAVDMIAGLSDLLRYTLDHAGAQRVALEEELAITRRYLEIERGRFPDRMAFEVEAAPEVRRAAVPTLLLQPLAENAIRHGIARVVAPGRIAIRAFREGERLRIDVFNTGALRPRREGGVGLRNTADRLRHMFGDAQSFELRAAEDGVVASLSMPWSEVA
jgi:hypothetical protein